MDVCDLSDAIWLELPANVRSEFLFELGKRHPAGFTVAAPDAQQHEQPSWPTLVHSSTGLQFNLLFGGTFNMGLSEEEARSVTEINPDVAQILDPDSMRPVHRVEVAPFLIATHPLTYVFVTQYMSPTIEPFKRYDGTIAWNQAAYCTRDEAEALLSQLALDLPSEAQWEYALRGNTLTPFYWGGYHSARGCAWGNRDVK